MTKKPNTRTKRSTTNLIMLMAVAALFTATGGSAAVFDDGQDDAAAQNETAEPGILSHDPCQSRSGVSTGIGKLTEYVSAGNSKAYFASINPGNQVTLKVQPYYGELKVQKYENSDNECRLTNTKTVSPTSGLGTGGGYSVDKDDILVVTYKGSYTTTGVYYRAYID